MTYNEFKTIAIPLTRVYILSSNHIISFIVRDVYDTKFRSGLVQGDLHSNEVWFFADTCFLSKEECIASIIKRLSDHNDTEALQSFEVMYYD